MVDLNNEIKTTVPTGCLIEDYQTLQRAIREEDWDLVQVVMDCLAATIDSCTTVPDGVKIQPSGSSVILPSVHTGILLNDQQDILCAAGKDASYALSGGVCQCDETCPFFQKECSPENGEMLLQSGIRYKLGETLSANELMSQLKRI